MTTKEDIALALSKQRDREVRLGTGITLKFAECFRLEKAGKQCFAHIHPESNGFLTTGEMVPSKFAVRVLEFDPEVYYNGQFIPYSEYYRILFSGANSRNWAVCDFKHLYRIISAPPEKHIDRMVRNLLAL